MIAADTDRITAKLPKGYRARPFVDADREPLVAERNATVHPMEQQDAAEWRVWERMAPDATLLRIVAEGPNGLAAYANIGAGSMMRHPDGAQNVGVSVFRADRGKGLGSALALEIEDEGRRRSAPRLLAGVSAAHPQALDWARKRGYREIGRRIESYVELAAFDPAPFAARVAAVKASGIALRTFADVLGEGDDERREAFYRALYEAQKPIFEDVPWATRPEHWTYEQFRHMTFESGQLIADASVIAYDGQTIAGFTSSGKRQTQDGYTWITGTARAYRGRGLATVMKVEALTRAKAKGLRAMLTTNDESNKAMRGINAKLGYQMLPAHVQLEKTLSAAP
jgi:ribosomal protein S18 acetylase RimI-like enzyme